MCSSHKGLGALGIVEAVLAGEPMAPGGPQRTRDPRGPGPVPCHNKRQAELEKTCAAYVAERLARKTEPCDATCDLAPISQLDSTARGR